MFAQFTSSPYFLAAAVFLVLGIILTITGFAALMRARVGSFTLRTAFGLTLLSLGGLAGMIAFGIQGYQTLTREEIAALISEIGRAHV